MHRDVTKRWVAAEIAHSKVDGRLGGEKDEEELKVKGAGGRTNWERHAEAHGQTEARANAQHVL